MAKRKVSRKKKIAYASFFRGYVKSYRAGIDARPSKQSREEGHALFNAYLKDIGASGEYVRKVKRSKKGGR